LQATTPELYARGTRATAGLRPLPAARLAKPVAAVLYHDGFARELNEACVGGDETTHLPLEVTRARGDL